MERQKLLRSAQNKIVDIFPTVKFASLSALSISNWHCRKIRWAIFLYSFPILTLEVKNLNQSHLNSPWGSKELRHLSQLNWFEMLGFRLLPCRRKRQLFPLRLEKLATHPLQPVLLDKHIDFSTLNTSKQHSLLFILPKLWEILQMTTSKTLYNTFF